MISTNRHAGRSRRMTGGDINMISTHKNKKALKCAI